jgi:transposase-like protein
MRSQGLPENITIDQSGATTAAITHYKRIPRTALVIRHCHSLNTISEQAPRAVKRLTPPRLGVKSFWVARCTIAGMAVRHAIRKGQLLTPGHS